MAAGKKKRRVSKHVQQAKEEQAKREPVEGVVEAPAGASVKPSSPRKKKRRIHVKDPSEGIDYLQNWKAHQSDSQVLWKFNKNTQSWLIRHQYEADKVSKATFVVLLEYLAGMPESGKNRVLAEATRRALRYKEYEKNKNDSDDAEKEEEQKADDGSDAKEKTAAEQETLDEEARWEKLSDHDKRKEYKRARQLLETLQSQAE